MKVLIKTSKDYHSIKKSKGRVSELISIFIISCMADLNLHFGVMSKYSKYFINDFYQSIQLLKKAEVFQLQFGYNFATSNHEILSNIMTK